MSRADHLEWYRTGEGPPRVLLLHGFTDSAACWMPLSQALGEPWPALTLDARGHGASGLPEEPYDDDVQARDATLVADAAGVSDLVVLGHSMGAATAAHLARLRPDLVRALVLEDPVLHAADEPSNRTPLEQRRAWVRKIQAMTLDERVAFAEAENPNWSMAEVETWAEAKGQLNPHVLDLRQVAGEPMQKVLESVACPTLLLRGSPSTGSLVTARGAEAAVEAARGSVHDVVLDGAGHSVRRDRPEQYLAELSQFLDSLAA